MVYPRVCGGTVGFAGDNLHLLVYPRVCGGTQRMLTERNIRPGLSPRMRGNPIRARNADHAQGSIPAYAGEPFARYARRCAGWVYPRVCGGTRFYQNGKFRSAGLSPRMRGNRRPEGRQPVCDGLSPRMRGNPRTRTRRANLLRSIPAYAGEPLCI